jgi:hypothetical protein
VGRLIEVGTPIGITRRNFAKQSVPTLLLRVPLLEDT